MRKPFIFAVALSICLSAIVLVCAQEKKEEEEKTICDQKFNLFLVTGGADEVGKLQLKATTKGEELTIVESMTMTMQGKKYEYTSTVKYKTKPSLAPVEAHTVTKIDGKETMDGTVKFSEKKCDISMVGKHDKQGNPIDPPKKVEIKDMAIPEGTIVFQFSLGIVGPMILDKAGQKGDIVHAEFPDDFKVPELTNLKENYKITRGEAKEDGSFTMNLTSVGVGDDKPVVSVEFDKDGKVTGMEMGRRWKAVPVKAPSPEEKPSKQAPAIDDPKEIKNRPITAVYIPKNLEECFAELKKLLTEEQIKEFKDCEEKEICRYHLGLGMWLRNNWGLWGESCLAKYFKEMGISHADDMSGIILTSFHRHLNNKEIRLEEQIKHYKEFWEKNK